MAPHYAPVVKIGGTIIDPHWSVVSPTALQPITIEWGASGHFDEVPPAALKLEIVHPVPVTNIHQYQGAHVEVSIDGTRTYRGRIGSTAWRRVLVWDEESQENRPYWIATIHALDPSAEVRVFRPVPIPVPDTGINGDNGLGWNLINAARRAADSFPYFGMSSRGVLAMGFFWSMRDQVLAAGLVSNVVSHWEAAVAGYGWHLRTGTDEPTAWELIREAYGTVPLCEPCYSPVSDSVVPTSPAIRPTVPLVYQNGRLSISTASGLHILPASILEVEEEMRTSTDATTAIGRVELEGRFLVEKWIQLPPEVSTFQRAEFSETRKVYGRTVPASKGDAQVYSRKANVGTMMRAKPFPYEEDATTQFTNSHTTDQTLNRIADAIAALNGQLAQPEVTIDLERDYDAVPAALRTKLLQSHPSMHRDAAILINGSAASHELGIDPMMQVIGGTLVYTPDGWRHTLRFAPVPRSTATPLTIAQLVTSPTATYDSYAENITLGLLGHITQGAS